MLSFTRRIRDLIYYSVLTEKSAAILRGFVNPAQKKLEKETSIYLFFQYCKSSVRKNSSAPNIKDSDELLKLSSYILMMSLMLFLAFRKDYTAKLEQSEKRARDLCAELAVEEQRRQELARIVGELLPESKPSKTKRPSRTRRVKPI